MKSAILAIQSLSIVQMKLLETEFFITLQKSVTESSGAFLMPKIRR